MQAISNNLVVLGPNDQITPEHADFLKIYLSGTVAMNEKADWQGMFIQGLARLMQSDQRFANQKFLIVNPKAPVGNPQVSLANQEYVMKMNWQLQIMKQVDGIFCNFLKKTQSPSAAYDFLMNTYSQKIIVRCPQECILYPMINLISISNGIPLLGESSSVINVMEKFFEYIPKFQEQLKYGLPNE